MVGIMGRVPVASRILMGSDHIHGVDFSGETSSFDEMVFGVFQESEGSFDSSGNSCEFEEDEENENSCTEDVNNKTKEFWESQHQLVNTNLFRTSSVETKIRQAANDALRESQVQGVVRCTCPTPVAVISGCRNCLIKHICERLRNAGFNTAVCNSKWRSSPDIPSGEHTFIDLVHQSSTKQLQVRVVIEINFRAEFEMARASKEYNRLIQTLPEVYVGKADRLRTLIKILCLAAKKCMKDNKMHMGPWRKHKYMQAKWFGTCETQPLPKRLSEKPPPRKTSRASMLTFDLVDVMPSLQHFTALVV